MRLAPSLIAVTLAGSVTLGAIARPAHAEPAATPALVLTTLPPDDAEAPQPVARETLFRKAHPHRPTHMADALLACRVVVTGSWDALAKDLTVDVSLAGRPLVHVRGADDTGLLYFTLPSVKLADGETIALTLWGRDLWREARIGEAAGHFGPSLPLYVEGERFTAECRALDRKELAPDLARATAEADHRLGDLERALTHHALPSVLEVREVRRAVVAVAGLVGWQAPEASSRLGRWSSLHVKLDEMQRLSAQQSAR